MGGLAVCPVRTIGGEGGRRQIFQMMRTPALFCAKYFELLKFMVCPHGQGEGLSWYGHFANKGEGVGCVRTSFMDGPLFGNNVANILHVLLSCDPRNVVYKSNFDV